MKQTVNKYWNKLPGWVKNKYVISVLVFVTYLLFFDSIDIPTQVKMQMRLSKLNKQTEYCKKMIENDKTEYTSTFSSKEQMEKFAREEYLMKKDDEDLFIIEIK